VFAPAAHDVLKHLADCLIHWNTRGQQRVHRRSDQMVGPCQQGSQQIALGGEVEVHGRPGQPGMPGDLIHRDLSETGSPQQPFGDIEDLRFANLALAGSCRALTLAAP